MVRGLAPAFLVLAGENSSFISADEVEISSRLSYKSRVGLVVMVTETKTAFTMLLTVTSVTIISLVAVIDENIYACETNEEEILEISLEFANRTSFKFQHPTEREKCNYNC